MKKLLIIWLLLCSTILQAQYTLIPDPYFEGYLVNIGIDTDGEINGQVLTSDIADETQLLLTANHFITDLTGIEDFESLEILDIYQMDITEIDLSQNINLWRLDISDVSLESLDVSANVNLIQFYLALNYDAGMFTSPIDNIDVSNNVLLNTLRVSHTLIPEINLTNNMLLSHLILKRTLFTEIDLVNNINLNLLDIRNMEELKVVNIKNGANWDLNHLDIHDNPNLQCLKVDDPLAVIAGLIPPYDNWNIENNPLLTITDDCNLGVEDNVLNIQVSIYPNPVQAVLYIENSSSYTINAVKMYDVLGRLVLHIDNPTEQLDVSNIASGLLFVQLETDAGVLVKKVVKE